MAARSNRAREAAENRRYAKLFEKAFGKKVTPTTPSEALISSKQIGKTDHFQAEHPDDRIARIRLELAQAQLRAQLEAESVLFYVTAKGAGFKEKPCKKCGLPFATTFVGVAFCSEVCRAQSLVELGIVWNINGKTDVDRWGGRIPKILRAEALKAAKQALIEADAEENSATEDEEPEIPMSDIDRTMEDIEIETQEIIANTLDE